MTHNDQLKITQEEHVHCSRELGLYFHVHVIESDVTGQVSKYIQMHQSGKTVAKSQVSALPEMWTIAFPCEINTTVQAREFIV